jgi:hypothetical protein
MDQEIGGARGERDGAGRVRGDYVELGRFGVREDVEMTAMEEGAGRTRDGEAAEGLMVLAIQ